MPVASNTSLSSTITTEATPSLTSSDAVVYDEYDINDPPPRPGPSWTRFICVSDTHSHIYPVPPGDVLLHAGDLSRRGKFRHLRVTIEWLKSLPHPVKIMIAGNHDLCLDNDWREGGLLASAVGERIRIKDTVAAQTLVRSEELRQAGIYYLEFESVGVTTPNGRTWSVYGSPAAPRYALGAFQYEYGEGAEVYARIPPSTEILLTHTPPFGLCDRTRKGKIAGCKDLAARLQSSDLQRCRLHVFGHIHESHGAVLSGGEAGMPSRVSVNAALAYGGEAIIVDLKN
ncbi:Metallo-dependent phosphatase [Laetiporus sulphureus 93-53]|uniref:Metallo-dependent phosphatase n=1 Tax=Laetiporus sulphureus 93-53 TaxID=1314785 RepID=A0A165G196_9APHY|nr:Metallo-dependent phosphatase [Laetiporus sulphureus 93-53]KZT09694.1 Metallo-dependent phosphatase [Laetiporus sulphureus 93-53]